MSDVEPGASDATPPFGPVQMLVLGFVDDEFTGRILPELRRLKELDVVRLLDLVIVTKDDEGEVDVSPCAASTRTAREFAGLIGALVGLDTGSDEEMRRGAIAGAGTEPEDGHALDDEAVWYLSDAIPAGSAAAIALIEHQWAVPLRDRILEAGGFALADEWIHPADLVAAGVAATQGSGAA